MRRRDSREDEAMTGDDRKTLRRVAAILTHEADCLRVSHCPGPKHDAWPDKSIIDRVAQADHDEMLALAKLLRAMAARP
jgi:hypothetical protein